jgi:hypothetical protein
MTNNSALTAQPRPHPFDLALVVIGSTMLAAGFGMFKGSPWFAVLGFLVGCALLAAAWWQPKFAGLVILVLSIPGLLYSLVFTLYTLAMPQALISLWGSAAFLIGGIGVLRRRSTTRRPWRHIVIVSLAAIFLLYFVILWPLQGRAILLSLPILEQGDSPQAQAEAGGIWAAYWTTPRVTIPEALESIKNLLEADGWTIVDTAIYPHLISAQRGAYSLEVIYEPEPPPDLFESKGVYMAAYVRRAKARTFDDIETESVTENAAAVRVRGGPANSRSGPRR